LLIGVISDVDVRQVGGAPIGRRAKSHTRMRAHAGEFLPFAGIFRRCAESSSAATHSEVQRAAGDRAPHQSGLIAAWRITLAHLSTSSAMNLVYSAGVATIGSTPRLASFFLNSALASAALGSWLRRSTISRGVLLGAASPYQPTP